MGNVSSSRPADLTSGYVGFEIRQAGDRGVFKRDPKKYTVQVENGPQLYATDYSTKCGSLYIYIQHMSLQKILVANGYLIGSPILDFVTDSGWRTRDADIIAAGGMTVCKVRKGSTFKFSHCGREYRWQRRPAGNWCRGFPDHATMKLVEMNGEACGPTMASLHLTRTPDHGRVATLYMPAAATANPEWQDLIILVGLVAMQQEFIQRRACGIHHGQLQEAARRGVGQASLGHYDRCFCAFLHHRLAKRVPALLARTRGEAEGSWRASLGSLGHLGWQLQVYVRYDVSKKP
ncbi:hypothetical protein WJX74_003533 [Apatococcus lobatus]|uniref:Uncharacterized protein n=1 Tax=Apatococcus lobatus TaxID=904363 RepID=A0AAW1S9R9_9CHLO